MKFLTAIGRLSKWVFLLGLTLLTVSWLNMEKLPERNQINRKLFSAPVQSPSGKKQFERNFGGQHYEIVPRYGYKIYGLVVSSRDLGRDLFNIDYWKDPYNIKDLCVIWGKNLKDGDYKKVSYRSGLWTCRFRYPNGTKFYHEELSNNHILPGSKEVTKTLRKIRPGDQIAIQGYLVDYTIINKAGGRKTSTTRKDAGNGACEIIYARKLRIIKDANAKWEIVYRISKYVILASIVMWITSFVFAPFKRT